MKHLIDERRPLKKRRTYGGFPKLSRGDATVRKKKKEKERTKNLGQNVSNCRR